MKDNKKTKKTYLSTYEKHLVRNGASNDQKKNGGGRGNWGTYLDVAADEIALLRSEQSKR